MLDPKFLAELEKNLGQKEASANLNQLPANNTIPILKPPPQSTKVAKNSPLKNVNTPQAALLPSPSAQPATQLPSGWDSNVRKSWYQKTVNVNQSETGWSEQIARPSAGNPESSVDLFKRMWLAENAATNPSWAAPAPRLDVQQRVANG